MCGIYAYIHNGAKPKFYKHHLLKARGPDEEKIIEDNSYLMAFYRLAINGRAHGMQPFTYPFNVIVMCNGEIYNSEELNKTYSDGEPLKSDCDIIGKLYQRFSIEEIVDMLDGEFAFILYDGNKNMVFFARDYMGVKPLYMSVKSSNDFIQSIELSSIANCMVMGEDDKCSSETISETHYDQIEPRFVYSYDITKGIIEKTSYDNIVYAPIRYSQDEENDNAKYNIYQALMDAVVKRIEHSERPIGFLLSGGLDSSCVLSLALQSGKLKTKPKVFTFGFDENAPDVISAKKVVNHFKRIYGEDCIDWHLVIDKIENGLNAIKNVIEACGTYDTTTIRASTPMYLISKYIKEKTDVKVILSGEGSDELFGGYLYFLYAPNDYAFRNEIIKLLNEIYLYDGLRADRTTAANGLEVRPPFLDKYLIRCVMESVDLVRGVNTKTLLRDCLRKYGFNLLPDDILNGKKEAFSDAVGYSWKDTIKIMCDSKELNNENLTDGKDSNEKELIKKDSLSPFIPPTTNESKYYQKIFYDKFGPQWQLTKKLWLPNQKWCKTGDEPSARVLSVY